MEHETDNSNFFEIIILIIIIKKWQERIGDEVLHGGDD